MIPALRQAFNNSFTKERYAAFLQDLNSKHPGNIEFRVAETPIFISKNFKQQLIDACESIVDVITDPGFKKMTDRSIPKTDYVPGENDHSHMIAFDFGICINEEGILEPQLIEMQGFPTLFAFQVYYTEVLRRHFPIPGNFSQYLGGYDKESYLKELKEVLIGDSPVENTILHHRADTGRQKAFLPERWKEDRSKAHIQPGYIR